MSTTKKIALTGVFTALAVALSYVEFLVPITFVPVPGFKLGIANLAIMAALFFLGPFEAAAVSALRLVLTLFLFSNVNAFFYSVCGALLSLAVMIIIKKTTFFSEIGTSVSGAVFHNIGQIALASLILKGSGIWYYFPALMLAGTLTGTVNGLILRFASGPLGKIFKTSGVQTGQ
ncbi:MAG: Gx transporter family protein [Clostridia bacterium]|nr:Gx transporter family protein [Clostridia bacterium]